MTTRIALALSIVALLLGVVEARHENDNILNVENQHHAQLHAADGGRLLTAPPAAAPSSPMAGVNPASFRYVSTYWAADLNRFNLSKTINLAAHRYHLSPVGMLAVALSECNGYTQSPRCDHEWPSQCDYSYGAVQINICTAAQFGIGNGVWDGHYGANATYLRNFEDNPVHAIWLEARVLRSMKNAQGGSFPGLDLLFNCGNYAAYIAGSQCAANHAHFLLWWNVAARFGTNTKPKMPRTEPRAVGYDLLDSPGIEQRLWRIPATYVVESSTLDEAGLTGGYQPIRDTDALVPQWTHQRMYLPGGRQDKYKYRGCYYIVGSGYAALWLTPTDAYFAILHMMQCPFPSVSTGAPVRYTGPVPKGQNDATGVAFAWMVRHPTAGALRTVRGGSYVGLTGWPSSYQYSNGSCYSDATCGIDAHQCQILTSGASDWFLWLASGHDLPKPKPKLVFHLKQWHHYTTTHHKRPVPAYHKTRLRPAAQFWLHHQHTLGYVMHEQQWHKKGGYESMSFTRRTLRFYPKSGKFTVVKR